MWLTVRRRSFDLVDPVKLARYDIRSAADGARATVGEAPYQFLVRPGVEPFWYFSCEDISQALTMSLQSRAVDAKFFFIKTGMDTVCHKLAQNIQTRLGAEVEHATLEPDGKIRLRWTNESGQKTEEVFDGAVIASTAQAANRITAELPEHIVSRPQREFLNSQTYVPNIHAAYLVDRDEGASDVGVVFPCGPGKKAIAAIAFHSHKIDDASKLPPGKELVSVYLSGDTSGRLISSDKSGIFEKCWSLAVDFYPKLPEKYESFALFVRPETIPVHAVGRYKLAARFISEQKGPVTFAGDYLATATVEGAIRSGIRAAEKLIRQ